MEIETLVIVSGAFLTAILLPWALKPLLFRLGSVDVPNARSSHAMPTVRGMGLAPAIAFITALFIHIARENVDGVILGTLALAAGISSIIGFVEDVWGIRASIRAGLQLCIGAGVVVLLEQSFDAHFIVMALGGIYIAAYINIANFMDGINGISALHGLVVGACYSAIGFLADMEWLTFAGAVLAVVFVAFLPWNVVGHGTFLGDVGSYLLGSAIGVVGLLAFLAGVPLIVLVGPILIYLVDSSTTLVRRILRHERWHEAHRTHIYQQLAQTPSHHLMVSSYVAVLSLLNAGLSLAFVANAIGALATLSGFILLAAVYIATPYLIRNRSRFTLRDEA